MKKKVILSLIVVISFFMFGMADKVLAQDDGLDCPVDDLGDIISQAETMLQESHSALMAEDLASTLALLDDTTNLLRQARAKCAGWYFEGHGTDALGPLDLDEGVYILGYTGNVPSGIVAMGMFFVSLENLDEDEWIGDEVMEMRTEFGEFDGRKTIRIDGGRYLISVDVSGMDAWTITLMKP